MGLLDYFNQGKQWLQNQPQMADPHANARRLMGGPVQEQQVPQAPQRQSILPQGTPQEPSMTPYQQPQNIGSSLMGYNPDLTGINNIGHQAGPETQTYLTSNGAIDNRLVDSYNEESVEDALKYEHDPLGWDNEYDNTYSYGRVAQGEGNDTFYTPMDNTGVKYAFQAPEEVGGSTGKASVTLSEADIPLSVITGDTTYNQPTPTAKSLLGDGGNFGFENEDEKAILELLEADNRRSNWQKFTDRGRDIFGGKR
jgi:hypothetical protein